MSPRLRRLQSKCHDNWRQMSKYDNNIRSTCNDRRVRGQNKLKGISNTITWYNKTKQNKNTYQRVALCTIVDYAYICSKKKVKCRCTGTDYSDGKSTANLLDMNKAEGAYRYMQQHKATIYMSTLYVVLWLLLSTKRVTYKSTTICASNPIICWIMLLSASQLSCGRSLTHRSHRSSGRGHTCWTFCLNTETSCGWFQTKIAYYCYYREWLIVCSELMHRPQN